MQQQENGSATPPRGRPPCASCRHRGKSCEEDCILAPYFPSDRSHELEDVASVFGIDNVMAMVRRVPEEENRRRLVGSLICEAKCRHQDPVLGMQGELQMALEGEGRALGRELAGLAREETRLERVRQGMEREHRALGREQKALEGELALLEELGRVLQGLLRRVRIKFLEREQKRREEMMGFKEEELQGLRALRSRMEEDQRLQEEIQRRWATKLPPEQADSQ